MAIDKLINSTQGDSIIAALNAISSKVGSPYNLENKLNPAYINYDSTHAATPETVANSGITSTDVAQIEMNKNNILLNQNSGFLQKNLFLPTKQSDSFDGAVITAGSDGTYTITSTSQTTQSFVFTLGQFTDESGKTYYVSGCPISSNKISLRVGSNYYGEGIATYIGTGASVNVTISFSSGFYTDTPLVFKPMISESNDDTFVPYALPNTTIIPALVECVDNGAKNLVNVPDITISASGGGYVTANNNVVLPAGKYVIIFNATATSGSLLTSFKDSGGNTIDSLELAMNGGQIKGTIFLSAQSSYFNAFANQPTTVTKYMIITEAMYDAGFTDYQPYALSNAELTAKEQTNENNILSLENSIIKMVAHTSANGSTSLSYETNINDFAISGGANSDKSSGSYLVICTNWSTTPAPYIGLLTFSGATTNNFVKTDVVTGFTPTITITQNVSNTTIAISGAAKISIYALR